MGKSKGKITNWKEYNQALINRGSLTFWMDDNAIANWYCDTPSGRRGRSNEGRVAFRLWPHRLE